MRQAGPIVLLSTPTSGTGSLWRLIGAIGQKAGYKTLKISDHFAQRNRLPDLANWKPDESNTIYLYNTPYIENASLLDPNIKIVLNFRDPRDLACNQYHWVFQHPAPGKSDQELADLRNKTKAEGIDKFVARVDNNIQFRAFTAIRDRLDIADSNILKLSYAQYCLDFDSVVDRLCDFFSVDRADCDYSAIEAERVSNLPGNPSWIGSLWTGTDFGPGRYREELSAPTIAALDAKYAETLRFLREMEAPRFRPLLHPFADFPEQRMVMFGKNGHYFLQQDSNKTIGQITGEIFLTAEKMLEIAHLHRERYEIGKLNKPASFEYKHGIIPAKEVVEVDSLPDTIVFEKFGPRPFRKYLESEAASIWRPFYSTLSDWKGSAYPRYPTRDTHWSHRAAYSFFEQFLKSEAPALAASLAALPVRAFTSRQVGDLGDKLGLGAEEIEILAPQAPKAVVKFKSSIVNEGAVTWYINASAPASPRAIVLHDSFTLWLMPFIAELFSEVIFIHSTVFDAKLVEKFGAEVVWCLQAERFFLRTPSNSESILDFISQMERKKAGSASFREMLLRM